MTATELMLGDLVRYTNPPYIRVASITRKKIGYHLRPDEPRMHYVRLCEIEPIPITPEILEKNGFKPTGSQYIIYNDYYDILMFELSDSIWELQYTDFEFGISNAQISFSYVHQLQHVLRLCGIEKEIQI